jgi:hypothetical protein
VSSVKTSSPFTIHDSSFTIHRLPLTIFFPLSDSPGVPGTPTVPANIGWFGASPIAIAHCEFCVKNSSVFVKKGYGSNEKRDVLSEKRCVLISH